MNLEVPSVTKRSFSLSLKEKLASRALHFKKIWEEELERTPKTWNSKTRKWGKKQPNWGFLRKTIDENFPKLRGVSNNVSCIYFIFLDFSFEYILRQYLWHTHTASYFW